MSPIQMMQAMIQGGVTENNVAAFEKLAELQWKFEARDAERQFNQAFESFQREKPVIVASTVIKNRGRYEKYEDIMTKNGVENLLTKHGFTVSFDQETSADRVKVTCTVAHSGGHKISKAYSTRCRPADNNTQADSMATTTAKRNALCLALNIIIRQDAMMDEDNDAGLEGDPTDFVTAQQADEIERRVKELGDVVNLAAFWEFAQAKKFSEIQARRYPEIDKMLARKEKGGR